MTPKGMTTVCRSYVIGHNFIKPICECGVNTPPDINPIYAGLERSYPRDSKNVSYVDVGLV